MPLPTDTLVHTVNDTPTLTGSVGTSTVGAAVPAVHVKRPDGTVVNRNGTWTDTATGAWSCTLQAGDLTQAGYHLLEVQVTFAGGGIQTFVLDSKGRETYFYVRNEYA
jgi:hypothetical protein